MTGSAKRMVRSGIALMQGRHGKRNLAFITVTVPSLPWDLMRLICSQWAELVRRFMEEVARELERHGLRADYVDVSEIQEERWRKEGVVAPHIHAIIQGRKTGQKQWAISKEKLRAIWERILGNFLGRPVDLPAATRIESIRKCAKRYMTKYMSKAGTVVNEIIAAGLTDCLPTAWWGMSHSLRREVKAGIVEVVKDTAELIAGHLEEYKQAGLIKWFGRVWAIENDGSWSVHYQKAGEDLEVRGTFKLLLSVIGEFTSREAMMQFVPDD